MKALIFDCDGVLIDTERDGHRVAFNEAFKRSGIDARWDEAQYGRLLEVAGGKERMRHYFDETGWPDAAGEDRDAFIAGLHKLKTAIFGELLVGGTLPLRPGISRIVDEAREDGMTLAVCSTSAEKSVRGALSLMGEERAAAFGLVLAGDVVSRKKPDPEIYLKARAELGLEPDDCVVVEDSRVGLLAATGAGLTCIVTKSTYTEDEDFSEAALVVPELGDPPGECVHLDDLRGLL